MHTHEWRRDREGGRERLQSRLHTISIEPDMGLDLTNYEVMTLAEIKSWLLH